MALIDIKLPELGEGVTEGELVKWTVKVGDTVKADQTIAEIMTDKATVEVPSPQNGVVKEFLFKPGQIVKVESALIKLETSGVAASLQTPASSHATASAAPAPPKTSSAPATSSTPVSASSGAGTGLKEIKLPELGEGVTEGELVKWTVAVGDTVKADQTVAEIMTDKATVEVPTPYAGKIKEFKFKKGEIIKVESTLLTLITDGSATSASAPSHSPTAAPAQTISNLAPRPNGSDAVYPNMNAIHPPVADFRVLATPATRRLAREVGVDINGLSGSGLAGRVTREDIMKVKGTGVVPSTTTPSTGSGATSAGAPMMARPMPAYNSNMAAQEERVDLIGIRKKIAQNLQMSKSIIPHFTIMDEADVSQLVVLRESLKDFAEKNGTKITYLPFVMKALVATIREFPQFNASIDDQASQIVYKKYFNIGFAADTPNGLVVPVIKNADQKTILEISKEIIDLSKRARDGKLKPDEMKGATITITNIGSIGGTYATPIINHPEVAIIGMYKITDKPIFAGPGKIDFIKSMNYTVTADHRLIDGAVAANFLKSLFNKLQNPGVLMMGMA